ncbi:MAG: VIT1/CCC1 transporter family protein [Candidatus Micrarchaeota archaeon]
MTKRKENVFDLEKHLEEEHHDLGRGTTLRDAILGGQDGIVNVLGVILGVAAATFEARIVIIAGLAATFAESISMAAVAYTSTKAEHDFYWSQHDKEKAEVESRSPTEVAEVHELYRRKGFSGKLLDAIVSKITSDKRVWLDFMMHEELGLDTPRGNAFNRAVLVGVSALVGSLIPMAPFFFLPVQTAIWAAGLISAVVLFAAGVVKAHLTTGSAWKTGLEMMLIGMISALVGYAVGAWLGVALV